MADPSDSSDGPLDDFVNPESPGNRIAAITFLVGAFVIALLTYYNLGSRSVYSPSAGLAFRSWDEYLVVNTTGLTLLPFLVVFGLLRLDAAVFGFRPSDTGAGRIAIGLYVAMLPVLFLAARYPDFYNQYPMNPAVAYYWPGLIAFELTYGFYFFCWEWFYRGFLTFGLARGIGFPAAVILQSIGFGIMHVGKPMPELIGSFAGGIVLGWLAIRARSFYPGFLLHWAVSATFDLLAIHTKPGGLF